MRVQTTALVVVVVVVVVVATASTVVSGVEHQHCCCTALLYVRSFWQLAAVRTRTTPNISLRNSIYEQHQVFVFYRSVYYQYSCSNMVFPFSLSAAAKGYVEQCSCDGHGQRGEKLRH